MKKLLYYFLLPAFISSSLLSCKKSLDIPNPNAVDESNFWKTGTDALAGINAVYGSVYRQGTFARSIFFVADPRSDDGWGSSGYAPLASLMNFTISDYNFDQNANIWSHSYQGIARANQVILNVPNIAMDETLKKRYVAEAKFFRAIYYYNLVTLFGNVPLITTPSKTTDLPAQATQDEVWQQIGNDLSSAIPDLPVSYDVANIGRVTKGAAYALQGRAFLQQHKYKEAADALAWLVTGAGQSIYDLVTNYQDNFNATNENNKESVFEIQFNDRTSVTDIDDARSNLGNQRGPFQGPSGPLRFNDAQMRRWVVYEFMQEKTTDNKRDPRLPVTATFDSASEGGPNSTIVFGQTFTAQYGATDKRVWYHKYANDSRPNRDETFEGPINLRVIRYADVLLMYAEALNQQNQTAAAYPYVDRVRQRAGLAKLSVTRPGLSQADFLKQLMHERITELTGEEVRWNDLARWGYFDDAAKLSELKARDPEFNNFVMGKHKWLPIPQSEIDINPNLHQNTQY